MKRAKKLLILAFFNLIILSVTSCIEPPLHLPGQNLLTEMPAVETQLNVVWNVVGFCIFNHHCMAYRPHGR